LAFAPDKAIIHLGLNDTDPRNWPNYRDEFIPDYLALIDTLRAVNPEMEVWICRMTPIFHGHHRFKSGTRDWHAQIQKAIEEVAHLSGVHLIDLHKPLYHRPDLFADALHPNAEGAEILAQTVYSAMTGDYGGLSLPAIYSDHMVIQRDKPFVLHGTANASSKITAQLGKEKRHTTTAPDGTWKLTFKPRKATREPITLTISDGDTTLTRTNILVGEVWLCSGQSNMVFMLRQATNAKENIAEALTKKDLRIYDMRPRVYTDAINWDSISLVKLNRLDYYLPTQWQTLTTDNAPQFSAIAYHFGAMLADSLDIPIGLICNAVGGAPIESFIDRHTLEYHPELVDILTDWRNNDRIQDWVRGRGSYNIQKSSNPLQRHPYEPCYLYEAGIAPLTGFPIRGFIWYQGESNSGRPHEYGALMKGLITNWRELWNKPELPFLLVQLPNFMEKHDKPTDSGWARIREAQLQTFKTIPNTALAVTYDVGEWNDIHPLNKKTVAQRLFLGARKLVYGEKITSSGPVYKDMKVEGNKIIISFTETGRGLMAKGGVLKNFAIAGEDKQFVWADAVIRGNKVIVSSKEVQNPVAVRYAWSDNPDDANLCNKDGLLASPFRTDNW
jgi:sialate O-acetylesterase